MIRRETLALLAGSTLCLLSVTGSIIDVASARTSWISSDDVLHIASHSCILCVALQWALVAFAVVSAIMLVQARHLVPKLRYVVLILLFLFLALPKTLEYTKPELLVDGQIVYGGLETAIVDMEANFNRQQVGWQASQLVNEQVTQTPPPLLSAQTPSFTSQLYFEISGLPTLVVRILGYSNATLNHFGVGWYAGLLGMIVWLFGVYSGDASAHARRSIDRILIPAAVAVYILAVLGIRAVTDSHIYQAEYDAALGRIASYELSSDIVITLEPLRQYFLFEQSIGDGLECGQCADVILRKASMTIAAKSGIDLVPLYLENLDRGQHNLLGLGYWISGIHRMRGLQQINEGDLGAAETNFRKSLEYVPVEPLSWYGLAVIAKRRGDFGASAGYLENALALQQYINFKRLTLEGQVYLMQSWAAFKDGDMETAHALYSRYLKPETW